MSNGCMLMVLITSLGCAVLASGCGMSGPGGARYGASPMESLCTIPPEVESHWASAENPRGQKGVGGQANAGRKGSSNYPLKAGQRLTLAEVTGRSGTVRRIWVTISERDPAMLRGIRLDMYWDGSAQPAVSAPIGDFFCHGLGAMSTFENALFASPEGRSFNCYIPMPFRTGMKIEVTNESGRDLAMFFYDVDYTLGETHGPDTLYFHAHWRRENPTTMQRDYEFLPKVVGRGRYLGVNFGVLADTGTYFKSWWGEGEVKAYIDGDERWPTLCGTGTEDYIGTGWGQGKYAGLYQGCPVADKDTYHYCFYRLHVPDPIYFRKDIRVTIQQIGCWDPEVKKVMHTSGHEYYAAGEGRRKLDLSPEGKSADYGLFERQDDWSSCAYFFLDRPSNELPLLAPVAKRVAGLGNAKTPE
jgi:hypothetical protein